MRTERDASGRSLAARPRPAELQAQHDRWLRAELRAGFAPAMMRRGYSGSALHLRRARADGLDLVSLVVAPGGGAFAVELARADGFEHVDALGWHVPAAHLCATHLAAGRRVRLRRPVGDVDSEWFVARAAGTGADAGAFRLAVRELCDCVPAIDAWFLGASGALAVAFAVHGHA